MLSCNVLSSGLFFGNNPLTVVLLTGCVKRRFYVAVSVTLSFLMVPPGGKKANIKRLLGSYKFVTGTPIVFNFMGLVRVPGAAFCSSGRREVNITHYFFFSLLPCASNKRQILFLRRI